MARLMVSFQNAEFAFDLRGDVVRVGSGSNCGLLLKDPAVGKEHLEMRRAGPAWKLIDLESASGTRVNGLYVNKHDLKAGDVVSIGSARLTFLADEGVAAAPIPGAAAAPAPIPQAYAPAPAYAPPAAAYAAPAPVYAAAPPAQQARRPAGRGRGRDRDRDRDDDRDDRDRRSRAPRRDGGGSAMMVLLLFLAAGGAIFLVIQFTREDLKVDPNSELVKQAAALEAKGDWEALLAYDGRGEKSFPDSYRQIQFTVERAKRNWAVVKGERATAEAEETFASQIKGPRENGTIESSSLVLRCDDFIQKFPDHPKANEANFIRISLTGEPSPAWVASRGGTAAGKGFVSVSTLLDAAEAEAGRRMARNQFVGAYAVYDMFLKKCTNSVMADYQAEFKASIAKKKIYVEQKAKDLFDKMEERAMVLDDRKRYEEEEALYKEARDTIALGENIKRCDDEITRLRDKR